MNSRTASIGLILSAAGAVLDFTSATFILQITSDSSMLNTGMSTSMNSNILWSLLLYGLGVLLLIMGILGVTSFSDGRMPIFAGLMTLYGIIMLIIGVIMLIWIMPMTQEGNLINLGMFIIGFSMIINGILMTTHTAMKT